MVLNMVSKYLKQLMKKNAAIYQKVESNYKTLPSYCLKIRKNTESKNPNVVETKTGRIM